LTCTWAKYPDLTFKPKISAKNSADASLSFAGTMVWSSRIAMSPSRKTSGLFAEAPRPRHQLLEELTDQRL
jgi:hypothetical protein